MSLGIIHRFKGGTKGQYQTSRKKVHPDGGESLPEGQTFHIGAQTEDGWMVPVSLRPHACSPGQR
jgi:hypothetical protein